MTSHRPRAEIVVWIAATIAILSLLFAAYCVAALRQHEVRLTDIEELLRLLADRCIPKGAS